MPGIQLGDKEQPPCRTADFDSDHPDIRKKKTGKSSLWLLVPLRTLSNWRYKNTRIHSFIHSFIAPLVTSNHCVLLGNISTLD